MSITKTLNNVNRAFDLNPQGGFYFFSAIDHGKGQIEKFNPELAAWGNANGTTFTVEEGQAITSTIKAMIEGLAVLPNMITYGVCNGLTLSYLSLKGAQTAFPNLYFSRIDGEIQATITEGVTVTAIH